MKKSLLLIVFLISLLTYSQHHIIDASHNFTIAGEYKDYYKDYAIIGYTYKTIDKSINHGVNVEIGVTKFDNINEDYSFYAVKERTIVTYSLNYVAFKEFNDINIYFKTGLYTGDIKGATSLNKKYVFITGFNFSLGGYYKISNNINIKAGYNYKLLSSLMGIRGEPEPNAHQIVLGIAYSL